MIKIILYILFSFTFVGYASAATFTFHEKTGKTTLVDADVFGIEDSAVSWDVKHITAANLKTYVLSADTSTLALTTDTSITEVQVLANKYISNYGASGEVDLTLPAVLYNLTRTVIVEAAQIIEVCPPSGELFDLGGIALDVDDCIDSPATAGSKAVFTRMRTGASTWRWSVDAVRGDWVDTGASD